MKYQLTISSSPHIRARHSTTSIMGDVCLALLPALLVAIWQFGFRVLAVTLVSVAACVFFEWGYRKMMKKDSTVHDLSAVVTGILLAFVCPPTVPYWVVVLGALFAIVVVKQLYGGIGKNFLNPALAGRAMMMASWAAIMTSWAKPGQWLSLVSNYTAEGALDAITSATPLSALKAGLLPEPELMDAFLGNVGGCIGEVSVFALLLGAGYLFIRKIISPRIPLCFIGTVALLTFLFPLGGNDRLVWMGWQLCSGGLMLGALFMATDYVTSPVTPLGQVIFGVGCGVLTVLIRYFGGFPEGVSYAILIMNVTVGLLDKVGQPRRFGAVREKGGAKA